MGLTTRSRTSGGEHAVAGRAQPPAGHHRPSSRSRTFSDAPPFSHRSPAGDQDRFLPPCPLRQPFGTFSGAAVAGWSWPRVRGLEITGRSGSSRLPRADWASDVRFGYAGSRRRDKSGRAVCGAPDELSCSHLRRAPHADTALKRGAVDLAAMARSPGSQIPLLAPVRRDVRLTPADYLSRAALNVPDLLRRPTLTVPRSVWASALQSRSFSSRSVPSSRDAAGLPPGARLRRRNPWVLRFLWVWRKIAAR